MNTLVALCAVGAEKILGNEIKHLGYKLEGNAPGRVVFFGDDDALYRANLCLRTSDRVYLLMARYKAEDFDALFDGVYSVNWQDYYKKDVHVVVDKVRTYKSKLNSEHSIQAMTQKAIYKKLGDKWHISTLPESGAQSDVRVYIDNNEVLVLLDLSGLPLHKRGYRTDGGIAPLRETTAAAMLQMMMWRRKTPLHDPFCGSGTIAIEAALYAHNIAPGFGRRFALENLSIYNKERAAKIRRAEAELIRTDVECRITGSDIDSATVERAKRNAEYACVAAGRALQELGSDAKIERPDFVQADFAELEAPYESGLLLCNPPYGERIGDEAEAEKLYKKMGCLFKNFPGWELGVITSHLKFQESIGKHASLLKDLKAGNLETKFYMYSDNLGSKHQNAHKDDGKSYKNRGDKKRES
ncbi:class I SAM-dependent RNA methyltransferase [Treponema sp.]|uniref:THUMP domain-containing class I SAM-dependent RNA methyltransferase n=1 Tax=Treponema sp. TaxID=166 RepID=UPI00298EAA04|nr:class I SAM-dependent RNA methyltransferase [Treponema sp.]MCR5612199.1 class I SAM-dependent RNA methyltransferase [Treponema sp.]